MPRLQRLIAAVVVAVAVLAGAPPAAAGAPPPAHHADWIMSARLADGAIAHHADRRGVWPYLSSFAAAGLARATAVSGDAAYVTAAWDWLRWYQAHQDANGFVTDYVVRDGAVHSTGDMDSTDAYAGMFLVAAWEAWQATGDRAALSSVHRGLEGALRAIEATQQDDGLTWAKPSWHVKYLMDNAETYAGLRAAEDLGVALGDRALAERARTAAGRMRAGVDRLWNPSAGAYDWAVHGNGGRHVTDWSILYPDALQQVWAVAFGLVDEPRAAQVMSTFESHHPNWDRPTERARVDGAVRPLGYWPVVGWAFTRIGDPARAAAGHERIAAAADAAGRAWPFTTAVAGQLVDLRPVGVPAERARGGGGPRRRPDVAAAAAPSTTAPATSTTAVERARTTKVAARGSTCRPRCPEQANALDRASAVPAAAVGLVATPALALAARVRRRASRRRHHADHVTPTPPS